MTKTELKSLLETILVIYPQFVLRDGTFDAWLMMFENCDYELVNQCFKQYASENEYPPVPASILKPYNAIIQSNDFARKECLYMVWQNATEEYAELKTIFDERMREVPLAEYKALCDSISKRFAEESDERISFREWINEH